LVFSRFLRYFVEVARLGSIRRASERLNVSASAIDRQILQAEAEMGLPLFERLPSGLRMTAAGELLLAAAKSWNKDYARLEESFTDLVGLRRGTVRIACIEALSRGFLPRIVRDIRAELPGIAFEIAVLDNKDVPQALVAGEADFGLMLSPQSSKDLVVRAFVDIEVGLITPPNHALARQRTAKFNQVAGLPMVLPKEPLALAELLQALANATGIDMSSAAGSDNVQMIKSLVESGVGVGVLSWLDVMNEVEAGSLAFMRLTDTVLRPLNLSLCVVPNRQLSNAAMLVLSRIEASLATLKHQAVVTS
jgi:DNA-binding transcriptional LysR family regulator